MKSKNVTVKIILLAVLLSIFVSTNVQAADMITVDGDEYDIVDDSEIIIEDTEEPDIVIEEDNNFFRSSGAINWTIKNKVMKKSRKFKAKKGDIVRMKVNFSAISDVTMGVCSSGVNYAVKAVDNKNKAITIKKDGEYCFFVKNKSGKTITAKGNYYY